MDRNYPKEKRNLVYEIYVNENLEGKLDLSDFKNLYDIYVSCYLDKKELEITNQNENAKIVKLRDVQEYISTKYPTKQSKIEVVELEIIDKHLEGGLRLNDFINLKYLDCGENVLTSLDVSDCKKLEELLCYGNRLTSLDVSNLIHLKKIISQNNRLVNINYPTSNPENLIFINVGNNNLARQPITIFSKYSNLKSLIIGSDTGKREKQNFYNRFNGSLEDLKNLKKLEFLDIESTDINSGLEYLPDSLEKILCSGKLVNQLKNHLIEDENSYNYQSWRKANYELVISAWREKVTELEEELQMEREEAEESAKAMDNFYRQNPPREDLALQNILQEISVDYLTTHRENKQLKKENEQLADSLIAVREFEAEVEFILVEEVNK